VNQLVSTVSPVTGSIELGNKFMLRYAGATDPGTCRTHNEDCFGILPDNFFFCVADGVGGMDAGEVASHAAVQSLLGAFGNPRRFSTLFGQLAGRFNTDGSRLASNIERAGKDILRLSDKSGRKMATTLVALKIMPDATAEIGNIGDSRAYLYRGNILGQVSHDHSVANELLRAGLPLSLDPAIHNPHKITKALGGQNSIAAPDIFQVHIRENDCFLLCSDGLTDMVSDHDIAEILEKQQTSMSSLIRKLIGKAIQAGGLDNVTVVGVKIERKN